MDELLVDEVYELLREEEYDDTIADELLGWLNRDDTFTANLINVAADWDLGEVVITSELEDDWSARMTVSEFTQILATHRLAQSLGQEQQREISADHAEALRESTDIRLDDLSQMGFAIEDVGPT